MIVLVRGLLVLISCGGREIRTLGGFNPTAVFKSASPTALTCSDIAPVPPFTTT